MATRKYLISFAVLALTACATTRYVPLAEDNITLQNSHASVRTPAADITVAYDPLDWAPVYFEDKLIAFRVGIRNLSAAPITITPNDFLLFDKEHNQFQPVTADVLERFAPRDTYGPTFGLSYGWGWDPWSPWYPWHGWYPGWGFGPGFSYWDFNRDNGEFAQELLAKSLFPSNPIEPGARVRGLIYFRGEMSRAPDVFLEVRLPGQPPQRFPFNRKKS